MNKKYRIFYFSSLAVLLAASAYPIYMGLVTLPPYFQNGYITTENYPRYIIPYTPMCISILLVALIFPLIYRFAKRYSLAIGTLTGLTAFFAGEVFFEQIKVLEPYDYSALPLSSWQYSLCYATPEVLRAIGQPIHAENNPAFKVHFYLIAALIIAAVIGLIWGFTRMLKTGDVSRKRPLLVQLGCVAVFVGLCIFACFTAFYRNGTLQLGTLSAVLMSLFFIVFGMTAGIYAGTLLYGRPRALSVMLPSFLSLLTTVIMYLGELVLTGGKLFRFGYGFFCESVGPIPFAPLDLLVILISGIASYAVLSWLNHSPRSHNSHNSPTANP